jgi:glucosamine kinase
VVAFLGIDAGGTHTECAVADERRILARASAGTAKIHKVGRPNAEQNLTAAVKQALQQAAVSSSDITSTCVGIAGASDPVVRDWVQQTLSKLARGSISILGDNEIAHHAAFRGGAGVLVVSGTGSIAYGRTADGKTARAGGWGPIISDEGSGTWIGRGAVQHTMRAYDETRQTLLTAKILRAWNLSNHDDLVREGNRNPGPDFSTLFPLVVEAAVEGDAVAEEILTSAGVELARLAAMVAGKLWPPKTSVAVCGIGGVITHSEIVRGSFRKSLAELRPGAAYDDRRIDPIEGAVAMARELRQ